MNLSNFVHKLSSRETRNHIQRPMLPPGTNPLIPPVGTTAMMLPVCSHADEAGGGLEQNDGGMTLSNGAGCGPVPKQSVFNGNRFWFQPSAPNSRFTVNRQMMEGLPSYGPIQMSRRTR